MPRVRGMSLNRIAVLDTDDEFEIREVCCAKEEEKDEKKPPDVMVLGDRHPEALSWSVPTIS